MTLQSFRFRFQVPSILLPALLVVALTAARAEVVGEPLPPWSPGTLDIHHINTGRGDAAFFLFPDGTTMLVDAGATDRSNPRVPPPRPDGSRTPGEWIARYIRQMLSHESSPSLDYGLITHFHGDHMGSLSPDSKTSPSGRYKLTGFTEIAEYLPIRNMLDRGWPDYNWPWPLDDPMMDNYRAFLEWQIQSRGMKVEQFVSGRGDQIVLTRRAQQYANFEVRNVAANGKVWTGVGTNTRRRFPSLDGLPLPDQPTENMCSVALRLSYGRFDYFTGGDMPGVPPAGAPSWHDIETPVAEAVGPVEVCVLNHHGSKDSTNAVFVSTLRPRVFVISVRAPSHPGARVLDRLLSTRLYAGPRDVFATNMMQANKTVIGRALEQLKSDQGHIVVRVKPGGARYQVIILDDTTESYKVKAVHGPYASN